MIWSHDFYGDKSKHLNGMCIPAMFEIWVVLKNIIITIETIKCVTYREGKRKPVIVMLNLADGRQPLVSG